MSSPQSMWDKSYFAKHYPYRDSHHPNTVVLTAAQALALGLAGDATVYYLIGTNARAINAINWPALNDVMTSVTLQSTQTTVQELRRGICYAREVMFRCTRDCWIRFLCLNPGYLRAVSQTYFTVAQLATLLTSIGTIVETEQFIPANDDVTFYPMYAVGIIFRADSQAGELHIAIEGAVEGEDY